MNINNISAGDIFPNYKALCQRIDDQYYANSGNVRKAQLETWSRFFRYEKSGIKFRIVEIYDTPRPRIIRARNIKFTNLICHLLMMQISESDDKLIITTTNKLLRDLNMMSSQFSVAFKNNTNLDDVAIDFIYSELKKRLYTALASLENNNIIKLNTYNVKIIDTDNWKTELLTDDENILLKQIESECIWAYQKSKNRKVFTTIQNIKLESGLTEYMKTRNQQIINLFGHRIMKEHHIEIMDNNAVYELDDEFKNKPYGILAEELNHRVCDSLIKTLETRTSDSNNNRIDSAKKRIENLININKINCDPSLSEPANSQPETSNGFIIYENKHINKRKRKCLSDYV